VLTINVRTVRRRLVVRAPDPTSAKVLVYMKADPQIDGPPPAVVDIDVKPIHGFLGFELASGNKVEGSASHILTALHRLHFQLSRNEFAGSPLIHGGTLTTDCGHVVFVGDKKSGKTTLLVYLASLGWPIAGDEHIILNGSTAIPRPRSLRVRPGALRYLSPAAAEVVRRSPTTLDWYGSVWFAVEPSAFGKEWRIRQCPIRHLVILRANHGGRSRIRELDHDGALQLLLQNVILPDMGKATALAWLRSTVKSAKCWELWTGRLEDCRDIVYQRFVSGFG
jgi:hypothetical protein